MLIHWRSISCQSLRFSCFCVLDEGHVAHLSRSRSEHLLALGRIPVCLCRHNQPGEMRLRSKFGRPSLTHGCIVSAELLFFPKGDFSGTASHGTKGTCGAKLARRYARRSSLGEDAKHGGDAVLVPPPPLSFNCWRPCGD